ncbi:CU044_5270 family protein [Actinomadura scrupuli]|uniref:CU044_5270 family protein n=1 Tax=Actinomadura scrupuli TaxID=559629 RepID=UPI003D97504F
MNDQALPQERDMPAAQHAARRAHLMRSIAAPPPAKTTRRRILIGGLATAGLATGLAAALIMAPTTKVGTDQPIALAGAAQVFSRAAKTAAAQPDLKPRPDQFIYAESRVRQAAMPGQPGWSATRRAWLSADGRHAGLLEADASPGGRRTWLCDGQHGSKAEMAAKKKGVLPTVDLAHPPVDCTDPPAYRKNLPTDPASALKWLYRNSQGGNPPDVQAFATVGDTLRESYVSPRALSAIFTAAAKIPGVTVGNAVDSVGRQGVAVGQTWQNLRSELIFDPKTFRLLGERTVVRHDGSFRPSGGKSRPPVAEPTLKEGTVLYTSATIRTAVVDKPGELPAR